MDANRIKTELEERIQSHKEAVREVKQIEKQMQVDTWNFFQEIKFEVKIIIKESQKKIAQNCAYVTVNILVQTGKSHI